MEKTPIHIFVHNTNIWSDPKIETETSFSAVAYAIRLTIEAVKMNNI